MPLKLVKYDQCGNMLWSHIYCHNMMAKKTICIKKINKLGEQIGDLDYGKNIYGKYVDLMVDNIGQKYVCYLQHSHHSHNNTIIISIINSDWKIISTHKISPHKYNHCPEIKLYCDKYIYLCYFIENEKNKYTINVSKLDVCGKVIWNYIKEITLCDMCPYKSIDIDKKGNVYIAYQHTQSRNTIINIIKINSRGYGKWNTCVTCQTNLCSNNMKPKIKQMREHIYITYTTDGYVGKVYNKSGSIDVVVIKLNRKGVIMYKYQDRSFNTIDINDDPDMDVDKYGNIYLTYIHKTKKCDSIVVAKFGTECHNHSLTDSYNNEIPNKNFYNIMSHDIGNNNIKNCIDFYKNQLKNTKKMILILNNIIELFDNFENEVHEILQLCANYNDIYNNMIQINKWIIYESTDNNGRPLSCSSGWCGISNKSINCSFEIKYKCSTKKYHFNTDSDIESLICRVNKDFLDTQNTCNFIKEYANLVCIGGLEIGIKINCVCDKPCILILTIYDHNCVCKNITYLFTINNKNSYIDLMNQIKHKMKQYIKHIYHDKKNDIIKIIFNKPYILSFKQKYKCPVNQFIISTYANDIPINYGTTTMKNERYIYPFISLYSKCNDVYVKYNNCGMGDEYYRVVPLNKNMLYYDKNISGNIKNILSCEMIKLGDIKFIDGYKVETINKYGFASYGEYMSDMISYYKISNIIEKKNIFESFKKIKKSIIESYDMIEMSYEKLKKL